MIGNIISAFVGTAAFCLLFNVPKRFCLICGLTGMAGFIGYTLTLNLASDVMARFVGALAVVICARLFSVWKKCPITVFLVPGIFPIIPGTRVYYTAYYLVSDNLYSAAQSGFEAIQIAFAIVLGIVLVVSAPMKWFQADFWKIKN